MVGGQSLWKGMAWVMIVGALACTKASSPTASVTSTTTTSTTTTTTTTTSTTIPETCSDETRPSIQLTAPARGRQIGERQIDIEARASDNVGVTRVEFYYHVNQFAAARMDPPVHIATRYQSPYRISWSVPRMCASQVLLLAWAYDACDNVGEADILVSVCN